jgi:YHYH protein
MRSVLQRVTLLTALAAVLQTPAVATTTKDASCRKAIANGVRTLAYKTLKAQMDCHDQRLRGAIAASVNCNDVSASSFPATNAASVASAAASFASGVTKSCSSSSVSAPSGNGYTSCPSPCNATTPAISTYADVAACLTCLTKAEGGAAIETAYGATPPVQGSKTSAWKCQTAYLGMAMRTYAYARMKYQISCQYDEDRGKVSGVDCGTTDLKGSIAKALATMDAKVAKCSSADLGALTSCATGVTQEQSCLRTAAETMTDTLFDQMEPPVTAAVPTPTATPITGCSQAANFLNVAIAPGAGSGYPKPSLSVTCSTNTVTVSSNGIPPYQFVSVTPNGLQAGNYTFSFPRNPQMAANVTTLPCLGVTGVAVDGLQFTGPNEAQMPDPYGDPVVNAILDECLGHTAPGGSYHYHALVTKCLIASGLVSQPWNNPDPSSSERSPIIAYALDGFPVYGPYECTTSACTEVVEMLSSWDNTGHGTTGCASSSTCAADEECATVMISGQKTQACAPKTYAWQNNTYSAKSGSQYLDQCNGHIGPNGDYHYHATETFPYINGCYRGTPMGVNSNPCPTQ